MLEIANSTLVIIDVQGKLAQLVKMKAMLFSNIARLIQGAQLLKIPIIVTEQKPDKLGPTVLELTTFLDKISPIEKESFSGWGKREFSESVLGLKRKQIIVTGIETHICVYQTAIDLVQNDFEVHVIADAVSSRKRLDHNCGLECVRAGGALVATTEAVLFEWIKTAADPRFKELVKIVK